MEELSTENTNEPTSNDNEIHNQVISPSIDNELRTFIAHIVSLSSTFDITMKAVSEALKKTQKQYEEFEINNVMYKEVGDKKLVLVKAECSQQFDDLIKQIRAYGLAFKTIPRSYIMSLISQYDAFLGKLIKVIYLTKPELLNASDKNLSFAQLVEFGSIEEAKEFILEKEIETTIRKSHAEQFQWMETKFNMPLRKDLAVWGDFIEITERRNLFVHTGGIVSNQYMKVCKENNVPLEKIKAGDELNVPRKYFEQAYNVVFEIGFKLAHVLWRKFLPDELAGADDNLIAIGYDTLHEGNYQLTKMIFDFATQTLKKQSREDKHLVMNVNRALAYKWSGNDKQAREIISKEDWSATGARFRLAEAVIMENYEDAYAIMQEIGKNRSEVATEDYRNWPLFKAIRREPKFLETFEKIFSEPYNKVEPQSFEVPVDLAAGIKVVPQSGDSNCEESHPTPASADSSSAARKPRRLARNGTKKE